VLKTCGCIVHMTFSLLRWLGTGIWVVDQTVLYVQALVEEVTQGSVLGFGVSADFGAALCGCAVLALLCVFAVYSFVCCWAVATHLCLDPALACLCVFAVGVFFHCYGLNRYTMHGFYSFVVIRVLWRTLACNSCYECLSLVYICVGICTD